ncbi:DUF1249 domain-containing protein [Bermanella sp. R86510]|uniref:DUF1249 domain-containing protein n=1 Tax=unclassified Bermanella TaxID=2627862 RepID=UPI0037C61C1D
MSFANPYVPDLSGMASVCEANFARLMRLLPDMAAGHGRHVYFMEGTNHTAIRLTITEQFKYTLTILVEQTSRLHDYLNPPSMEVRLYQDVRMAEVIRYDTYHRFNGIYHYPNEHMHHPDEKQQINAFLGEWLEHCLEHGKANIELNFVPNRAKM